MKNNTLFLIKLIKYFVVVLMLYMLVFLWSASVWFFNFFGEEVTFAQILAHCFSMHLEVIDSGVVNSLLDALRLGAKKTTKLVFFASFVAVGLSCLLKRDVIKTKPCLIIFFVGCFLTLGGFLHRVNFVGYVKNLYGKDNISALYYKLDVTNIEQPKRKRDVILIYVESLEACLINERSGNHIQDIVDLEGVFVGDFKQAPGANWSIAGMIASQCAIPQGVDATSILRRKYSFRYSVPGALCLSDILKQRSYRQVYLIGVDKRFDDMEGFYSTHGFDEIVGQREFLDKGVSSHLFTSFIDGLNDGDLFNEAYKKLKDLCSKEEPYFLIIKTSDTHPEKGYPSPVCASEENSAGLLGAYRCVSKIVKGFVRRVEEDRQLRDLLIIVMGDHLLMGAKEYVEEHLPGQRNVFFKIVGRTKLNPKRNKMNHFDVAPTILDLLGFGAKDGNTRMGLGVSLFSDFSGEGYDRYYDKVMNDSILGGSEFFTKLHSKRKRE